jgi:tRNA(Ile)-lysidine synthetase-like protein
MTLVDVRRALREDLAELPADALVLVACSGGPDSVALAVAARAERATAGAVVVDHGLRPEAAAEAQTTAAWLRQHGLDPVLVVRATVVENGDGLEAAARDARYRVLFHAAVDVGAAVVLLGHTRDDQAETVLLGLVRGSGVRSLAGMPRQRGIFRRPMLDLAREVVHAAVPQDAPLVDDPHNSDDRFTRARVRHTVLPMLERELGPGIAAALARTADLARADADALGELADATAWDLMHGARDEGTLDVEPLTDLHGAVLSRVVRIWLVDAGCPPGSLTAAHVQRVTRLVTDWHGQGAVALPGGVEAFRDYGRLCTRPTATRPTPDSQTATSATTATSASTIPTSDEPERQET